MGMGLRKWGQSAKVVAESRASDAVRFSEPLCAVLVQILLGVYFFLLSSLEVIWKHTFITW